MEKYEYGAMSSRYEIEASSKLTAYATIVLHYQAQPHMVVIYEPKDCESWVNITGQVSDRLDEIFGGVGSFEKYLEGNIEEIKICYKSVKQLV